jgi:hypothetical protein
MAQSKWRWCKKCEGLAFAGPLIDASQPEHRRLPIYLVSMEGR